MKIRSAIGMFVENITKRDTRIVCPQLQQQIMTVVSFPEPDGYFVVTVAYTAAFAVNGTPDRIFAVFPDLFYCQMFRIGGNAQTRCNQSGRVPESGFHPKTSFRRQTKRTYYFPIRRNERSFLCLCINR